MEALGRVAGGVAHDFNNLLTVILGNLSLLGERIENQQMERELVEALKDAAARAAGLTGQLLAFSRRQVLKTRVLDLCVLVEEMSPILSRLIGESIQLAVEAAPGPCRVHADPVQLEQVVLNLAINARDAMPEGGTLSLRNVADNARRRPGIAAPRRAHGGLRHA